MLFSYVMVASETSRAFTLPMISSGACSQAMSLLSLVRRIDLTSRKAVAFYPCFMLASTPLYLVAFRPCRISMH